MYDLVIIGGGPAGITASIYAARKRMKFVLVTKEIGGQTSFSGNIENYTGYNFITGPELVSKFEDHMKKFGINLKEGEKVLSVKKQGDVIKVTTDKEFYETKTVIVASGKRSKELGVPGEKEFKNKGLSYCATCDGPLFSGKDVAVIGGGNSAMDAALQLINIANHVYIINNTPALGGDAVVREKIQKSIIAVIMNNTTVTEIIGDKVVTGIKISKQGKEERISVKGVFVEIGLVPNSEFVFDVAKNELNEIKVNCQGESNIPGIFAAGDVTDVPEKQIIVAAGEGTKAVLSAFKYVAKLPVEEKT